MSADPGTGFRAELQASLDPLDQQIAGLESLSNDNFSLELTGLIGVALIDRHRRRELIVALLRALDALISDGWPDLPKIKISEALTAEREKQRAALEAAFAIFETQLRAAKIVASEFGAPQPK